MDTYTIIGYRHYDFVDKDGIRVSGYNLFCTFSSDRVEGEACDRLSVTDRALNGYFPQLGDRINVYYNKYGRITSVALVSY